MEKKCRHSVEYVCAACPKPVKEGVVKPVQDVYKVQLLGAGAKEDTGTVLKIAELAIRLAPHLTGGDVPKRVEKALQYIKEAYRQGKDVVLEEIPYAPVPPGKGKAP